ncbi:MAG: rRNA maturation RNase YbeY [Rhodospirillales bacterium]
MDQPERPLSIDIDVRAEAWREAVGDPEAVCEAAAVSAYRSVTDAPSRGVLSVLLSDDDEIAELNKVFRKRDGATNVLSFPAGDAYPDGSVMLGDIAVAFDTVRDEAARDGRTVADHLSHMIVHGVLHLLGFDHESDAEADAMEKLEVMALGRLGIGDPYADGEGAGKGGATS